MISSKQDYIYIYYLEADRLGMKKFDRKKPRFLLDAPARKISDEGTDNHYTGGTERFKKGVS